MAKLVSVYGTSFISYTFPRQLELYWKFQPSRKINNYKLMNVEQRKRIFQKEQATEKKKITPYSLILLVIPVTSFGLGVWQIHRKKWKENLIAKMKMRSLQDPVPLPENLDDLNQMEYYPVCVKGKFNHDKEILIGPRSLLNEKGELYQEQGLFSTARPGFLVVTPFELSDRNVTILVNRGWIPAGEVNPKSRLQGQITGEVELIGLVRLSENRPQFGAKNNPEKNIWSYRDIHQMAEVAKTHPIFIDAVQSGSVSGGHPIAGQTRINLRNEHLSYIITWFGLSLVTSILWYIKVFH